MKGEDKGHHVIFHNNKSCTANGVLLGHPCVKEEGNSLTLWSKLSTGYLNITVSDTTRFDEINIRQGRNVLSSAYFVPNCKFPTPGHSMFYIYFLHIVTSSTYETTVDSLFYLEKLARNFSFPFSRFEGVNGYAVVKFAIRQPEWVGDYSLYVN